MSLVVTDAPATGQPTISGGGQVGKTLTAATDDIEDLDGLPTTPTFTYQWVRVDVLHRHRHPRGGLRNPHADRVRSGQADQGEGELHRLPGPRRGPAHERRVSLEDGTVTVVVLPWPLSRGQRLVRDDDGGSTTALGSGMSLTSPARSTTT